MALNLFKKSKPKEEKKAETEEKKEVKENGLPAGAFDTSLILKGVHVTEKAMNKALRFIFLLMFLAKFLSLVGPKVTPPPFQIGERIEPCLARPVPFCRQGFLPPPRTSDRSLVCAKTCRELPNWATMAWCKRSGLTGKPKTSSGNSIWLITSPD